ncbi:MAG: hypothetical protein DCF16_01545 [Alphaproteobacteria bacterium]|nr:MAG: hypothetical protein DCF16_01545 [Alphaproteobacteria bacterium]
MGARLKQMSLFTESPALEAPAVDPEFVRRHLLHLLRLAETAERLPWSEAKTASWEKMFAELAADLPDGEALNASFQAELKRLRASA